MFVTMLGAAAAPRALENAMHSFTKFTAMLGAAAEPRALLVMAMLQTFVSTSMLGAAAEPEALATPGSAHLSSR